MAADLTRESQRTKAMAIIGSTIGAAFALSFVAAPVPARARSACPGIFALTGVLALAAMAVVRFVGARRRRARAPRRARVPLARAAARSASSLRLNVGIFALHAVLMALFVVVPVALVRAGLPAARALVGLPRHAWSPASC